MSNRQLFVTKDTSLDGGEATYTDPSQVPEGSFAVLNAEDASSGSENLGGTDAPDKMILVRGGTDPQIEFIEKAKINSVQVQSFRSEVLQQSAVGFNGESGELSSDVGEATIKVVRLEKGYEPFPRVSASTGVRSGDLPYDVAADLAEQFRGQVPDRVHGSQTRGFIQADVISDITTAQAVDGEGANVTASVVNGSRTVTLSGSAADVATGDVLRLGDATDSKSPVYVISGIDGTSVTLDRPWTGENASGVAVGSGSGPAEDDAVGVLLTAKPSEDGEPAISFETAVDGILEYDSITSLATPTTANGSSDQLKNLEEFSWGSRGYYYTNYFPQTPESHVVDGQGYDLLTLIYENNNDNDVVSQNRFREIHVAYPEGNVALATLESFFTS